MVMEDTEADLHLASIDRSGEAKNKKQLQIVSVSHNKYIYMNLVGNKCEAGRLKYSIKTLE